MTWDDVLRRLYKGARILPRTKRNGQPTDAVLSTGEMVTRATTGKLLRMGLVDYCGRKSDRLRISPKGALWVRDQIGLDRPSGSSGIRPGATIIIRVHGTVCPGMRIVSVKDGKVSFSKGGTKPRWWLPLNYVKKNIIRTAEPSK